MPTFISFKKGEKINQVIGPDVAHLRVHCSTLYINVISPSLTIPSRLLFRPPVGSESDNWGTHNSQNSGKFRMHLLLAMILQCKIRVKRYTSRELQNKQTNKESGGEQSDTGQLIMHHASCTNNGWRISSSPMTQT